MPRIKSRRMLTFLVALCSLFFILNVSRSYQPFLVDFKSLDYSFTQNILFTISVPLTKLAYRHSSKDETKKSVSYDLPHDLVFHLKNEMKRNDLKKKRTSMKNMKHKKSSIGPRITNKLWFMDDGQIRPNPTAENATAVLWPEQDKGDRIVQQLMYIPENYKNGWNFSLSVKNNILSPPVLRRNLNLKKIVLYFGIKNWPDLRLGRRVFVRDKCPVNTCTIVNSLHDASSADAVLFRNKFVMPKFKKPRNQVWILYLLECPLNTQSFRRFGNVINWTATYRRDSDIVTPYEKFVPYNVSSLYHPSKNTTVNIKHKNYAVGKKKKVAWFVSNCNARNKRLQYAYELSHYIDVDIYGSCGVNYCPRRFNKMCMERIEKDYKFYLSFENSNCKDYITEKFFINGLGNNLLPIVMGARRQDYAEVAPPHSFIHVDDFASPKELAEYLHVLDGNDTLYNEYFAWKGSGEFINTYFWCRLCALLHAPQESKSYPDFHHWWSKPGTCDVSN